MKTNQDKTNLQIYQHKWYIENQAKIRAYQKIYAQKLRNKVGAMNKVDADKFYKETIHLKRGIFTRSDFMHATPERIIREWPNLLITP